MWRREYLYILCHETKYFFFVKKVWYMKWTKLKPECSVIIVLEDDIRDETLISHVDMNRPFFSPSNFSKFIHFHTNGLRESTRNAHQPTFL